MKRMDDQGGDGSLMALEQYMQYIKRLPSLSEEEMVRLMEMVAAGKRGVGAAGLDQWVLEQAKWARDRLVEGFQWRVVHFARRYVSCCRSMSVLDLIQEGNIGLLKAIESYEHGEEWYLPALVTTYVRGAMFTALYRRDSLVRVDDGVRQALRRLRLAEERLCGQLGDTPSCEQLAAEMDVKVAEVVALLVVDSHRSIASLQHLLAEGREEDEYQFTSVFAQSVVEDVGGQGQQAAFVHEVLAQALTPRQREVIRLRYGLEPGEQAGLSQQEVASRLGVTRESVRNVEHTAWRRLAACLQVEVQQGQSSYAVRSTRHEAYYTAGEAMQRLRLTTAAFYHRVYRGAIVGVRGEGRKNVWLFPKETIDQLAVQSC